jgi:hypothetical protein
LTRFDNLHRDPELSPELPSSIINSPPNTPARITKLNIKLDDDIKDLDLSKSKLRRHLRRSQAANVLLSDELELTKAALKHAIEANAQKMLRKMANGLKGLAEAL